MKTTQAIRNIRKFKKHQTSGVKGRMITDDYGNRYSVKANPNSSVARRHTLSRGKERAHALTGDKKESKDFHDNLKKSRKYDKVGNTRITTRHTLSAKRRNTLLNMKKGIDTKHWYKEGLHTNLSGSPMYPSRAKEFATEAAKELHKGKRKPKDFTK